MAAGWTSQPHWPAAAAPVGYPNSTLDSWNVARPHAPIELIGQTDSLQGSARGSHAAKSRKPPQDVDVFLDRGVEECVPVPRSLIGRVIGKKGAVIADVRTKSGAWKVDATDQSSDPCQVKILGTEEAARKARELILELIKPVQPKHTGSNFVEISQGRIGKVIGMKGAQVNEIEARTGTRIDIDYDRAPCRVYISGSDRAVSSAKEILLELTKEW